MNTMFEQLNRDYCSLLKQAEQHNLSRKDALSLIHKADKIRMEMLSLQDAKVYPSIN